MGLLGPLELNITECVTVGFLCAVLLQGNIMHLAIHQKILLREGIIPW